MRDFIKIFPNQIDDAVKIGESIVLNTDFSNIKNIVIGGQGGSGIGGVIVKNLLRDKMCKPIFINQDYALPSFVNENTLFIASSYSGNTEETISALKQAQDRNSVIICICSGGEILEIAKKHNYDHVIIPSGGAPRAMLCYSIVQLLFILSAVNGNSQSELKQELIDIKSYLMSQQSAIVSLATQTVETMANKMPFIYAFPEFEGVALRFKQQLNENSKQHASCNLIPEMNHNEIVGWRNKHMCSIPIFLDGSSSKRNKQRLKINMQQINVCVDDIIHLSIDGVSYLHQYFYFIHLVDWVSLILAEKNNFDPDEIDAIHYLKNELKKTLNNEEYR